MKGEGEDPKRVRFGGFNNQIQDGRVFYATIPLVTSEGKFAFLLENPATSGRSAYIYRLTTYNGAGAVGFTLLQNPDNYPVNELTVQEGRPAHPRSPKLNAYYENDGDLLTGYTETDTHLVSTADYDPIKIDKQVPPGVSLGINLDEGTLFSSTDVYVAVWWVETDY